MRLDLNVQMQSYKKDEKVSSAQAEMTNSLQKMISAPAEITVSFQVVLSAPTFLAN